MGFLEQEETVLKSFMPNFEKTLSKTPLLELEKLGSLAIKEFRQQGGTKLLIPKKYGGWEASPLETIQFQRAVGSCSPSLAVATTMHHATVIIMNEMSHRESDFRFLEKIASQNQYLSSGFAEGRTDMNALFPYMQVKETADGFLISGSKKPCSLSMSMDFLTVSILVRGKSSGTDELAIAVVPANSKGIERKAFWNSLVLAGSESDEVILNEVLVADELIFRVGDPKDLNSVQAKGFLWFELLISASYLGIVSILVRRVLLSNKGTHTERVNLAIELEGAMSALEGVAYSIIHSKITEEELLTKALLVRYSVQRAIEFTVERASELLGGMAFVSSPEVSYLIASARALAFHPPSRLSIAPSLDYYLMGNSFMMA